MATPFYIASTFTVQSIHPSLSPLLIHRKFLEKSGHAIVTTAKELCTRRQDCQKARTRYPSGYEADMELDNEGMDENYIHSPKKAHRFGVRFWHLRFTVVL